MLKLYDFHLLNNLQIVPILMNFVKILLSCIKKDVFYSWSVQNYNKRVTDFFRNGFYIKISDFLNYLFYVSEVKEKYQEFMALGIWYIFC